MQQVFVRVGQRRDNRVEILSGLDAGQEVVTGVSTAQSGTPTNTGGFGGGGIGIPGGGGGFPGGGTRPGNGN